MIFAKNRKFEIIAEIENTISKRHPRTNETYSDLKLKVIKEKQILL